MKIDPRRINPFTKKEPPVAALPDHEVHQLAKQSKRGREAEAEDAQRQADYYAADLVKMAAAAEASRKKAEETQAKKVHNFGKLATSTCHEIEKKVHGVAEDCAAPLARLAGLREELERAGVRCPRPVLKSSPALAALADLLAAHGTSAREAEEAARRAAEVERSLAPIAALRGLSVR